MTESWDEVVAGLTAAYGLEAWGTTLGHGSFLTVELGGAAAASAHGATTCGSSQSAWRIEDGESMIAGSEDDRDALAGKVTVLDGRTVLTMGPGPTWSVEAADHPNGL